MTIGLTADYFRPFVLGETFIGSMEIENLSFENLAVGGCWAASFSKAMSLQAAEDWYESGLGRTIKFYDQYTDWVWEGFVNKVTINPGDNSEVRGPLLDVKNRTSSTYTPRDFSVFPPVDGSQTSTTIVEDDKSQKLYGILEGVVGAGATPKENAEKVRDLYLLENSIPKTTGQISISPGDSKTPTVTIELLGFVHWLMVFIYENTSNTTGYLSDKIKDILGYDPNGIISTQYKYIEENLYLVNDLETKQRYAWDVLTELLSVGNDSNDDRRLFGIYENKVAKYNVKPTDIKYEYKLGDRQVVKEYNSQTIVRPWAIKPGNWITVPDFLIGRNIVSTNLNKDPRNKFIESVKYTSPYSVDLSGGQTDRLSQMLAKITYTGGIY